MLNDVCADARTLHRIMCHTCFSFSKSGSKRTSCLPRPTTSPTGSIPGCLAHLVKLGWRVLRMVRCVVTWRVYELECVVYEGTTVFYDGAMGEDFAHVVRAAGNIVAADDRDDDRRCRHKCMQHLLGNSPNTLRVFSSIPSPCYLARHLPCRRAGS
jgi:hypothetical protein